MVTNGNIEIEPLLCVPKRMHAYTCTTKRELALLLENGDKVAGSRLVLMAILATSTSGFVF